MTSNSDIAGTIEGAVVKDSVIEVSNPAPDVEMHNVAGIVGAEFAFVREGYILHRMTGVEEGIPGHEFATLESLARFLGSRDEGGHVLVGANAIVAGLDPEHPRAAVVKMGLRPHPILAVLLNLVERSKRGLGQREVWSRLRVATGYIASGTELIQKIATLKIGKKDEGESVLSELGSAVFKARTKTQEIKTTIPTSFVYRGPIFAGLTEDRHYHDVEFLFFVNDPEHEDASITFTIDCPEIDIVRDEARGEIASALVTMIIENSGPNAGPFFVGVGEFGHGKRELISLLPFSAPVPG